MIVTEGFGIFDMQKAELHAHLNGCIPPQKTRDLVRKYSVHIPPGFDITRDLQVLKPVDSLSAYFKPWLILKHLPVGKECLAQMVDAAVETLVEDNVTYVEFRKSPFNICEINNISIDRALGWLSETLHQSSERHGIKANLIVSLSRDEFDSAKSTQLLRALKSCRRDGLVVGVDLSGDESIPIGPEVADFYRSAKDDLGLGVTIHAGETGGLDHIQWAVEECHADRIGHGLAAGACPRMLELLRRRDVCLEVSLISNLRTGIVRTPRAHPVMNFIASGVPFVLTSDNPQVHGSKLSDEYALFSAVTCREDLLSAMFLTQNAYSFADRGGN